MADGGREFREADLEQGSQTGIVCVVIRAETNPGADDQFLALLSDLAHTIDAEEDGCLSYRPTRLLGTRSHFAVHARFENFKAFERHAVTPHFERVLPRLMPLLATPVSLEIFLEV